MDLKVLFKRFDGLRHTGLRKMGKGIALAAAVGAVAGLGAIVFQALCLAVSHVGLEWLAGYQPSGPAGEQQLFQETTTSLRWWMLLLVPAVGGLLSGLIVYRLAPEAEGHGTDSAIEAFHHHRALIRARVPIVKMFSSAITLGTGGSGGREGPIAQIGAGFGSYLASILKLSEQERRSLMAAGLGAGIGAIFHAPLAGAIFSAEVLYRDPDFEAENLIPAFIATTSAYCVFSLAFGFDALFIVPQVEFDDPRLLLLLLPLSVLAVVMALGSLVYVKCLYGVRDLFRRLAVPKHFKPMIGALLTGLVAVLLYSAMSRLGKESGEDALSVLSFGYGFLQKVLNLSVVDNAATITLVLVAVGLGKILTTSLTIGSGGSGGVFGPSMVIGGSLGALVGLAFAKWIPGIVKPDHVVIFTILGMASFFGAAANTPVSTLIMVSEMTSSYTLLLPSMWVCALAYLLSRSWTLYEKQVASRVDSPAHRGDFIVDVLEGLCVKDSLRHAHGEFVTVPLSMPLSQITKLITETRQISFPVVDNSGKYYGLFGINNVRQFLYDSGLAELAVAQDLAATASRPLTLEQDLSSAIRQFAEGSFEELPVVDASDPEKVIALLRRQDLIATYSAELMQVRQRQKA